MIFVSFGNSPKVHSFDRLAKAIDDYAFKSKEKIFVQSGHTSYHFLHCQSVAFLTHDEMHEKINNCTLLITHGGWGTISEALTMGKIVVAVPRLLGAEHFHDQSDLVRALEKSGYILGVYNIKDLPDVIEKAKTFSFKRLDRPSVNRIIIDKINEWCGKN